MSKITTSKREYQGKRKNNDIDAKNWPRGQESSNIGDGEDRPTPNHVPTTTTLIMRTIIILFTLITFRSYDGICSKAGVCSAIADAKEKNNGLWF